MTDLDLYDEQFVLAAFLAYPDENRWELDGVAVDLFSNPVHREILGALIEVRDSGRRIHWRRVRRVLRAKRLREAWLLVYPIVWRAPTWGVTAAMGRLVYRKHNRRSAV